jgi:hypothetical protein
MSNEETQLNQTPATVPLADKPKDELVRIVEMMSEDMRWYVDQRNHLIAALTSALGQLRVFKDAWMADQEATPSVDAAFAFRRCADSLAPIIAILEGAK